MKCPYCGSGTHKQYEYKGVQLLACEKVPEDEVIGYQFYGGLTSQPMKDLGFLPNIKVDWRKIGVLEKED